MIHDIYDFGIVVKNKVPIADDGVEKVPVGQLGIVIPSMKYCGDKLLVKFKWRHKVVSRSNLNVVACSSCRGYGAQNATTIWNGEPLCRQHHTERQFLELWGVLTEGELPEGVFLANWLPIDAKAASSLMWLLQERYHWLGGNWEICSDCEEPFNANSTTYATTNDGIYCDSCLGLHGEFCDRCGEFFDYDALTDGFCAGCLGEEE